MAHYTQSIQTLMNILASLPGIGPRSAERIAFHLLKQSPEEALRLAEAIRDVKTRIKHCSTCFNLTEADPCDICADAGRDSSLVCVVEQPKDLLALESTQLFKGVYHVLLGRLAPLEGVDPQDLTLAKLFERVQAGTIREIILGTNPNLDGDATAMHIQEEVRRNHPDVAVTRLARGLAAGTQIEYANKNVLADAIAGRQRVE
jgi:recombination protein RecR